MGLQAYPIYLASLLPFRTNLMLIDRKRPALYIWMIIVVIAEGIIWTGPASAQVPLAAIRGTIADPSGAAIAEARLLFRQASTGIERPAQSRTDGVYQVESLDPGEYQ